jgi:hypothetical protein
VTAKTATNLALQDNELAGCKFALRRGNEPVNRKVPETCNRSLK